MLLPFLFLFFASFVSVGQCEVVSSFNKCPSFFLDGKLPDDNLKPLNPARICQTYRNKVFYATMYDRTNRIPVYSAYLYTPSPGDRSTDWMIEPQLVRSNLNRNMEDERESTIPPAQIAASQATFNDYAAAPYYVDKGHLNPVVHHNTDDSKAATFTLTNIVPQFNKLNQGPWVNYETQTMSQKTAQNRCTKVHVMVGAVPGKDFISNKRVNYPSYVWSASCCVNAQNKRVSWAVIASNDPKKPPAVTERTLRQLEQQLATLYGKRSINLFNSSCY
ncbi:endonuclease domain-containing 1 protein-like [Eublepharis macularius]|uniref:Endonuclease domain-containing 1 protein-like n=1 Tax=Eublepharis macularius TaxID=481883 RepID=A0AA97L7H7_EUBMA|nr:endonuclease domain-containing 1 protein-like [Eublepharis macularius]